VRVTIHQPLFAWECLEDSPSLRTVQNFLDTVPDERLLASLRSARGRGRNDYPVSVLWGTVLLQIVLRHPTMEACLGDLRRNADLRRLIGIASEDAVPNPWNVSRFLEVLGKEPHRTLLGEMFEQMIGRLVEEVPDLGRTTAGDATGLRARRTRSGAGDAADLPIAKGGRKEYTDDEGKVVKVVEWFGYKLHLIVDVKHEVVLAWRISSANVADNTELPEVLGRALAVLPEDRIETLAFDKACDDGGTHELLDDAGVKPVIQNRSLWKGEPERMLPGHDGRSNIVYDEAGTVYCYDKTQDPPVRHRMAYIGHEPARRTLKYRCPARHGGWTCPCDGRCNAGKSYGKTVRVPRDIDLRRFPPIPRATKKFERLYKGRTAVERVNARLKIFWGVDDGNVTGSRRFHAQVAAVMIVHAGLATLLAALPRTEPADRKHRQTLGRMRLSPIAKALRKKIGLAV